MHAGVISRQLQGCRGLTSCAMAGGFTLAGSISCTLARYHPSDPISRAEVVVTASLHGVHPCTPLKELKYLPAIIFPSASNFPPPPPLPTCVSLQEVFKGTFYSAGIAWLPPESDDEACEEDAASAASPMAISPAASPNGNTHNSIQEPRSSMDSSGSNSNSPAGGRQQGGGGSRMQGVGGGAGVGAAASALPVSDARVNSVSLPQQEQQPGPYVSLASFPLQGR